MGPAGAKAKWVRVELKKIETLPGGGQANSYYDHVGPTPISLWQSSEDYSVLQSVRNGGLISVFRHADGDDSH